MAIPIPLMMSRWLVFLGICLGVIVAVAIQYSTLENVPQLLPEGTPNIVMSGVRIRHVEHDRDVLAMRATEAELFLDQQPRMVMHAVQGRIDAYALTADQMAYELASGHLAAYNQVQLSADEMLITTDHLQLDPQNHVLRLLQNNRVVLQDTGR